MVQLGDCDVFYQVEITWKNTRHVQIVGNQVHLKCNCYGTENREYADHIAYDLSILCKTRLVIKNCSKYGTKNRMCAPKLLIL